MTTRQVAVVAGAVGGAAWVAKLVIMGLQGGPEPGSVPENIAFLAGLVGMLVFAAATGAFLALPRPVPVRVASAVAAVVGLVVLVGIVQLGLASLPGDAWLQEELVFGLAGAAALAVTLWLARGGPAADPTV